MSKRRRYSPEFKREAVALTGRPGISCRQVALEIGINPNMLTGGSAKPSKPRARRLRAPARHGMRKLPGLSASWRG